MNKRQQLKMTKRKMKEHYASVSAAHLIAWMKQLKKHGIQVTYDPSMENMPDEIKLKGCYGALLTLFPEYERKLDKRKKECRDRVDIFHNICLGYKERQKQWR